MHKEVAVFRSDRFAALRGLAALLAVALLFALLAAALLFAWLAVACNGDDDKDKTPAAGETPAADETPTADDDEDEDDDGDGDEGLSDLEALAAEAEGVTAKVTYKVTMDVAGVSTEQEWVLVQRPPDSRFEIAGEEGGAEFRTIIITTGGKSYLCTAAAGQKMCLASEADEADAGAAPLFDLLSDIPQELGEGVDTSQRKIAGVDAACFTASGALTDIGEGEVCFSDEGLLLYLRSEVDGASSEFEATSVSTDVTDADFEPPYDIIELPDFEDLEGLEDLEDFEFPEQ